MKHYETTYKSVKLAVYIVQNINNQLVEKYRFFLMYVKRF